MCQVVTNCEANPFMDAARAQSSKKRPRCEETAVGSPMIVEAVHYNLRIKRVRAPAAAVFSNASPCPTAAKIKSRPRVVAAVPQASMSRDLNAEVKTMQRKMALMQEQVKDATDGIRQLRQLVGVLAMQRHKAALAMRAAAATTTTTTTTVQC